MNGFKKSIESELKDLHVSEELKIKTLKKCKEKNKNLKVITATAASVAFLTISLTAYNNFYKKSSTQSVENSTENYVEFNKNVVINSENVDPNKVVISDNSKSNEEKDSDKVVKKSEQASIDININNSNVKETDSKKVLSNDVVSNSSDTKIEKAKETDTNNDKLIDKHTEKENKINVVSATPTVKKNIETIGVSDIQGTVKNIYKEKDFLFLEVQNLKGEIELFYAENNSDWEGKFKNLKVNDKVNIKYALGTPKEYRGKMAMPLNDIMEIVDKSEFTDEMWKTLNSYDDVDINKEWTISFIRTILNKDIDNSSVYIVDSNGNKIPTKIAILEDQKSLKVTPINPYKYGETYYLFVGNNLVPSTKLYKGHRMQFTVRGEVTVK